MLIHTVILVVQCIKLIHCLESVPFHIYEGTSKTVIFSNITFGKCCGAEVTYLNSEKSMTLIDLPNCDKQITCENLTFKKQILPNKCAHGVYLSGKCVSYELSDNADKQTQNAVLLNCLCLSNTELLCENGYHKKSTIDKYCKNKSGSIVINDNDFIFQDYSSNLKFDKMIELSKKSNDHLIRIYKPLVRIYFNISEPVKDYSNIKLESSNFNKDDNTLHTISSGPTPYSCSVLFNGTSQRKQCESNPCETYFHLTDLNKFENKNLMYQVHCGDTIHTLKFFREKQSHISNYISSHFKWKGINEELCTLLIVDILFGYIIFRSLFFIISFIYSFIIDFMPPIIPNIKLNIKNIFNAHKGSCNICDVHILDMYDRYLHKKACKQELCPYCDLEMYDINKSIHVATCPMRTRAINKCKSELEPKLIKLKAEHLKKSFLKNLFFNHRYKNTSKNLWLLSLIVITVFCLITPADSLVDRPCNRLSGMTVACDKEDPSYITSGSKETHIDLTPRELGQLDKIVLTHNNVFYKNSIHRFKAHGKYIMNKSPETMEIQSTSCNIECYTSSIIKYSGPIKEGMIGSYSFEDDKFMKSIVNIFIVDVDIITPVSYLYSTSPWVCKIQSKFSCTSDDCSSICGNENCMSKIESKKDSTGWSRNPSWCWSINQGCSCGVVSIEKSQNEISYSVYKKETPQLRFMLCIDINSEFIDCSEVHSLGVESVGTDSNINVINLNPNDNLPEKIIVTEDPNLNTTEKTIKFGAIADMGYTKAGSPGDFQYNKFKTSDCSHMTFDKSSIKLSEDTGFAKTPKWSVRCPKPGSFVINNYNDISDLNKNSLHKYSTELGSIITTEGTLGSGSFEIELNRIKLHRIEDKGIIKSFKVVNCQGEFGSLIGAICTFTIDLENSDSTIVHVFSQDGSTLLNDDAQTIFKGPNVFRKFMYVRNIRKDYHFCIRQKKEEICDSFKNNFTEPSNKWSYFDDSFIHSESNTWVTKCDEWFGTSCVFERMKQIFETIWSNIILFSIGLLTSIIMVMICSWSEKKMKNFTHEDYEDENELLLEMSKHK